MVSGQVYYNKHSDILDLAASVANEFLFDSKNGSNTKIDICYHVNAWDNYIREEGEYYDNGSDHTYQKDFKKDEYDNAIKEYERCEPLFENINLTKFTNIIETIKEKKTEHIHEFHCYGKAQFFQDIGVGDGVIEILECKCGEKKDGKKIYIRRYDNE